MSTIAARLAIAMVQFAQSTPASREAPSSPWRWQLVPDGRRFSYEELLGVLEALPKPVCIAPAVNPGVLAVWAVEDAHPTQRARIQWELQNQGAVLEERFVGSDVPDATPVRLELHGDVLDATMGDVRAYAAAYLHMGCGWRVSPPRAGGEPHRMTLLHVDGSRSPGSEFDDRTRPL